MQRVLDHLLFPANMWLGEEASGKLGLTPIDHERIRATLPHCAGRLLDVGCGSNRLVAQHGQGIGTDLVPYDGIDIQCDSSSLPFHEGSFDTVALLACLNHITRRRETLEECYRVLRKEGKVLVTMIPRWVGFISHRIRERHDPDQQIRGISHDEDWGLSTRQIRSLVEATGFELISQRRFMWGLNCIYVARKRQEA